MEKENQTLVTEFILLGFSYQLKIKIVLFVVCLVAYIVTLTANGLIITVTLVDSNLHFPMYFFLCNLSFIDIFFSSVVFPIVLQGLFYDKTIISYSGCLSQMYMSVSLGQAECFLLAVMAWDRYVAICSPLNYHQIINNIMCIKLAVIIWSSGFLSALTFLIVVRMIDFCGHNVIDFPGCDIAALLLLACTNTQLTQVLIFLSAIVALVFPVSFILFTYIKIISTIIRMTSADSRYRVFSTCGSHLLVVATFYGTAIVVYLTPRSIISAESNKVLSLFYAAGTPMLNPLIYTLRNKDVKGALKKLHSRIVVCQ